VTRRDLVSALDRYSVLIPET